MALAKLLGPSHDESLQLPVWRLQALDHLPWGANTKANGTPSYFKLQARF
jgi:hypothetical protein